MSKKKTPIIIISVTCILIIIGAIGFQKYNNMINPHKAFEKDLRKIQDLQVEELKNYQEQLQNKQEGPHLQEPLKQEESFSRFSKNVINILLLGVDSSNERESRRMGYRSDSIIATSIDLDTKEVRMLSIPRDTYTDVPGNKNKDKINHAMAFGGGPKKKGNKYAVEAVEGLLGIDIHYYITVDMDAVKTIVDTIGGVVIDVERDMGSSEKVLEKGERRLNGDEALIYIQNRNVPSGDFARIGQQQRFMIALFQQVKKNGELSDVVPLYLKMKDKIYTDLKIDQIGALVLLLKDLEPETIETFTLKGKGKRINGIYYLEVDRTYMEEIIEEHFKREGGNIEDKENTREISILEALA